jgi:hypothetical protein
MKKLIGTAALLGVIMATAVGCEPGESEDTVRNYASKNVEFEYVNRDKVDSSTTITTLRHKVTGCQYAVVSSARSSSGVGGVSLLYDKDGRPLCSR